MINDVKKSAEQKMGKSIEALKHDFAKIRTGRAHTGLLDHIAAHSDDGIPLQHCMNCGPTLVVRREQFVGESVYCRN